MAFWDRKLMIRMTMGDPHDGTSKEFTVIEILWTSFLTRADHADHEDHADQ
jgi:hypothetical protein